jgi:hypothetical protein
MGPGPEGKSSASATCGGAASPGGAVTPPLSWRSSRWRPNRRCEPRSTLACDAHWLPERVDLPAAEELTLEQLDFAWDFLDPHIEAIEREIFCRTADLFRADGDLIFWDTTRGSFAVDEEDEVEETRRGTTLPALRQAGDSTEGHDSDPQVGVGLALTRDGLPGRSWVFPGTTVDTTTGAQVKEDLRG